MIRPVEAPYILLIAVVMLGIAWKWTGRWPEVVCGGVFIAWGLILLATIWYVYTGVIYLPGGHIEHHPPPPFHFYFSPQMLIRLSPLVTGILLILAYRRTRPARG
jgi:hypothetical protein